MRQAPSQHDIAARLKIGQKTVSRVFGGGCVSEETRQRVLEAAKSMGYRPNAGARAMRTGRTGTIILLQSTRRGASNMPQKILNGLIDGLAAGEANLVVARFDDERLLQPGALPKALRELTGDGVVVNYETDTPGALATVLRTAGLPAVWINCLRDTEAVRPDDRAAGRLVAERLITAGHRRLAWADLFIRWTHMCHYSRTDRLAGFQEAAQAAGIPCDIWSPDQSLPSDQIAAWFANKLGVADGSRAIGCNSDIEFLALLWAAARIGLSIPEDLSLAGIQLSHPFVGVDADHAVFDDREIGMATAAMMLGRLNSKSTPPAKLISPTFRTGRTVATPAR